MLAANHFALVLSTTFAFVCTLLPARAEDVTPSAVTLRRSAPAPLTSAPRPTRLATSVSALSTNQAAAIPPVPEGITELKFSEMFKPIGRRGLEHSDKLRALDGRRVRILGYMVKQSRPMPWTLLLAPVPLTLHESEYGFAEDMPSSVIHVFTPRNATPIVPFTPGLMLLTGTLNVGNREEPDDRVSTVRLTLDPPTPEQRAAFAQLSRSQNTLSTNAMTR